MEPKGLEISVIIPSYKPDLGKLKECLEAINSSARKPLEVILVDDGSGINYPEEIQTLCRIIKNKDNRGPAHARNVGAKEGRGDILCFIDSDIRIKQTTLDQIAGKFCEGNIAAVQTVYSCFTPVKNFISQYQNLYQHYNFKVIRQDYLCTLSSYAIAIKKDAFFEAGGFPDGVKNASVEDELLGIELYSKGYDILLAKDISVEHMAYFNLKTVLKRMYTMGKDAIEHSFRRGKLNKIKFSKTHHRRSLLISILISPLIMLLAILPGMRSMALLVALVFLLINANFFMFIYKARGILFMLKSMFVYYFVCLSAFLGIIKGGINCLKK